METHAIFIINNVKIFANNWITVRLAGMKAIRRLKVATLIGKAE